MLVVGVVGRDYAAAKKPELGDVCLLEPGTVDECSKLTLSPPP